MTTREGSTGRLTRVLVAVAASASLVIGLATAVGAVRWVQIRGDGTQVGSWEDQGIGPQTPADEPLETGACSQRACNFLLLGSDSRAGLTPEEQQQFGTEDLVGGENRADTIMLIHTDPDRQKAVIISFPRDLWVPIPGVGEGKINSAFSGGLAGGGPRLVGQTVADLTGLRIDHYLYVDFGGFQGVVDALGGVEMCPPAYLANEDGRIVDPLTWLDIEPGCQRMDGATALAFVRTRHLPCDNVPDFSRIGRQQQFLRALITQMLRPSQIVRAPGLVEPVLQSLRRDEGFLPGDLVYLVGQMRGLTTGAAEFRAVPGVAGWEGSAQVIRMDPSAEELFEAIRQGRPISEVGTTLIGTPISPANVTVAVIDDGSLGRAQDVETMLGNAGFDVSPGIWPGEQAPADATGPATILYAPGHDGEASVLSKYLPGVAVAESAALEGAPLAVVITSGYEPVVPQEDDSASQCPAA